MTPIVLEKQEVAESEQLNQKALQVDVFGDSRCSRTPPCGVDKFYLLLLLVKISKHNCDVFVRMCACLTLERRVSSTTRRRVASLMVAAGWGGVAEVPSALAYVQTVTASREEVVFPLRHSEVLSLPQRAPQRAFPQLFDLSTFNFN